MINLKDFSFAWTYDMMAWIRQIVFEEDTSLVDITDFFVPSDIKFITRSITPSKYTHLHELIEDSISISVDYDEELTKILESYMIPFSKSDNLEHLVQEKVVPLVTNEVFTILYSDRELLKRLNEIIALQINDIKFKDYPNLLVKDGVVHRCTYWPKWLQKGLIYRDKGRCCLCLNDLSGLLYAGADKHIDHIVPLHLGGTNDPTNLQILCGKCNKSKGASQGQTTRKQLLYW